MLSLDDDDYGLLGYGDVQRESLYGEFALAARARVKAEYNKLHPPRPEVKRAATARYKKTPKGKAMKARSWKKYYEANKARIMARVAAHRAAKRKTP